MASKKSFHKHSKSRRDFIKASGLVAGAALIPPVTSFSLLNKSSREKKTIGHGDFKYKVIEDWGNLNHDKTPVLNCHEMIMDKRGRLIMITDEVRNNIIIYDRSGKLLDTWGHDYPGGHGLTLSREGTEEFLFITDTKLGKVFKTTLEGRVVMTINHPMEIGVYKEDQAFKPTETAIGPTGDIYVADGYGSQYILQYNSRGEYIRHFGGRGNGDEQFDTCHGVAIDNRKPNSPTLLCTSRTHNSFKRFTLDGKYLNTIFLPGAFVCRPVIDDQNIYSGVCWSRLRYLNRTDNSGFVTILDKDDKVVSNPGGTKPRYENGSLQLMVQEQPIFKHCHDVCVDNDKNLYICQWNAGKTYPIKLERT